MAAASSSSSSSAAAAAAAAVAYNEEWRAEEHALTGLLPDDTIAQVMRGLSTRELLTSFAFVCRRWHRLCTSFAVYELVPNPFNPTDDPWRHMTRKKFFELVATNASTIEKVNLRRLRQLKSEYVISLCQSLPKLRDLSIAPRDPLGTADMESITSHLPPQLVSLDIHMDQFILNPLNFDLGFLIDDNVLGGLHQQCPHLQKLNLCTTSTITPHGLNGLLQACQSLTSLDLHSPELGWPEIAKVFTSCRSLCHFALESTKLTPPSEGDEMDGFSGERSEMRHHESNHFFGERRRRQGLKDAGKDGVFYTSEGVSLGRVMPKHLTSIRLYDRPNRAANFELSPMQEILQSSGFQLQQLHAQGVYNTNWQTISVCCSNLKLLDLTHEESLILTRVEEVVLSGVVRSLKKLERIALPSATDRILTDLGQFCPNLKEIRIQAHYAADQHTEYAAVTDRGVIAIAEGCPDLRVLSLSGCRNLTVSSARALAFHCRRLEVLMLNGCHKFRNDAVAALLPRLGSSLLFLDLVGCKITQSILTAFQKCNGVTTLRVVAIPKTLWDRAGAVIAEMHKSNRLLEIRRGSGTLWTGFYHQDMV